MSRKVAFFGIMEYGNFNYQLAPILLAVILGTLLIVGSVFTAPTWRSLATFIFTLGYSLYLFEYEYAQVGVEEDLIFYSPLLICFGVQLGILVISILINVFNKKPALDATPLWDFTGKFKTKINLKVLLVLWGLYFIEAIMQFEGYSLLRWLTVFS